MMPWPQSLNVSDITSDQGGYQYPVGGNIPELICTLPWHTDDDKTRTSDASLSASLGYGQHLYTGKHASSVAYEVKPEPEPDYSDSESLVLGHDVPMQNHTSAVEYELEPEPDYSDTEAGSASDSMDRV